MWSGYLMSFDHQIKLEKIQFRIGRGKSSYLNILMSTNQLKECKVEMITRLLWFPHHWTECSPHLFFSSSLWQSKFLMSVISPWHHCPQSFDTIRTSSQSKQLPCRLTKQQLLRGRCFTPSSHKTEETSVINRWTLSVKKRSSSSHLVTVFILSFTLRSFSLKSSMLFSYNFIAALDKG